MDRTIDWLLQSEPWTAYRTRRDLLGQDENEKEVIANKQKMIEHPRIQQLISELLQWPGETLNNHKKAGLLIHKLSFIAEIGITIEDPPAGEIAEKVMQHMTEYGVPEVIMSIPKVFGGTGETEFNWMLCDAPLILFSLVKMGLADNPSVGKGIQYLAEKARDNGWPCAATPKLGKFHGPGRKDDPCPYATLLMMKALAVAGDTDRIEAQAGAECLLSLWERSREAHPYLFYMGTDFRKLKAPFIWYDIVHFADVLSRFEWLRDDERLIDMVNVIKQKEVDGRFIPESVWMAWKELDFGQKKEPSSWLTFLILRIKKRMEAS